MKRLFNTTTGILGAVLISASLTMPVVSASVKAIELASSANHNGAIFFSNKHDPLQDGFNNATYDAYYDYYSNEIKDNDNYKANTATSHPKWKNTQKFSADGRAYVPEIEKIFSASNLSTSSSSMESDKGDLLLTSGFNVATAFTGVEGEWDGVFTDKDGSLTPLANNDKKMVILLDDDSLATQYSNAVSISYKAEGAGLLASVAAAIYTEWESISNSHKEASIVMWGGMPFPSIRGYMTGFAQGIDLINEKYEGTMITFEHDDGQGNITTFSKPYKPITIWNGGYEDGDKQTEYNTWNPHTSLTNKPIELNDEQKHEWYTFGFDMDTSVYKNADLAYKKTENAIAGDASIIFPIAGGNTGAVIKALSDYNNKTTKIIGVDTDNTVDYPIASKYIIGSATKNLEDSGKYALWAMDDYDGNGTRNFEDNITGDPMLTEGMEFYNGWVNKDSQSTDLPGISLVGDKDNGGVSFTYLNQDNAGDPTNGEQDNNAMNITLLKAMTELLGIAGTDFTDLNNNANSKMDELLAEMNKVTNVDNGYDDKGNSTIPWLDSDIVTWPNIDDNIKNPEHKNNLVKWTIITIVILLLILLVITITLSIFLFARARAIKNRKFRAFLEEFK